MLQVSFVGKFKKDYKFCQKRGYNIKLLQAAIDILAIPEPLPPKNKDHLLTGNYAGYRECHILPNRLIYQQAEDELILYCTGTHTPICSKYEAESSRLFLSCCLSFSSGPTCG